MSSTFGSIFTFDQCYPYNNEAFAFTDCILLKPIGNLTKGTCIPEAIVNVKTSKLKFNTGNMLFVIPFSLSWNNDDISHKSSEIEDSDFDNDSNTDTSTDSDSDSDVSSEYSSDETDD